MALRDPRIAASRTPHTAGEPWGRVVPLRAPSVDDDTALLAAVRAGRPGAARSLWARFAPLVHRLLRRTLGPAVDVEDVAQDVFLCLFRKLDELRDPEALRPFVVSITMLTAKAKLRRRWRERKLFFQWDEEQEHRELEHRAPPTNHEARQALQRFYRLLDRLNATDRAVFVLRFVEQMELTQVAQALAISLSTAKRKASRVWQRMCAAVARDPSLATFLEGGGS